MTRLKALLGVSAVIAAVGAAGALAAAGTGTYSQTRVTDISARCSGQNAEVEQAADPSGRYVYEGWIGCNGIGFARSSDGGLLFHHPIRLRDSGPGSWDPAISVAPNGAVYVAFMVTRGSRSVPVVLVSLDHGKTFPRRTALIPRPKNNWGDRPFIAAGAGGRVYLTWDYGPSDASIRVQCFPAGSCALRRGELNAVMQVSANGARSFGATTALSPGFPAGGASSAPLVIDPSGQIDVLFEAYAVAPRTLRLGRGHSYFTSSSDGGRTWTKPVSVGASAGSITPTEWWIDGSIAADAAGNLYATWDTQRRGRDTGWLSYSTDHGVSWSPPAQVAHTTRPPNIVQVAGGPAGVAYVAWLSHRRRGYAMYLRAFSIANGWLSPPDQVSHRFGNAKVWPGDTFGISALGTDEVMLSWGSATRSTRGRAEIFATRVTLPPH